MTLIKVITFAFYQKFDKNLKFFYGLIINILERFCFIFIGKKSMFYLVKNNCIQGLNLNIKLILKTVSFFRRGHMKSISSNFINPSARGCQEISFFIAEIPL